MSEECGGIAATDGPDLVIIQVAPARAKHRLGVWPRAVTMGIVGLHHDVVNSDPMTGVDGRRVVEGAEPEVPGQHIGGSGVSSEPVA